MNRLRVSAATLLVLLGLALPVQAATTFTLLDSGYSGSTTNVFTTGSITPAANKGTILIYYTSQTTLTVVGNTRTWGLVGTGADGTGRRLTAYCTYDTSAGIGGTVAVTTSSNSAGFGWAIFEVSGADFSGGTCASFIVNNAHTLTSSVVDTATGSNSSVSISSYSVTAGNASLVFCRNNTSAAVTVGSGYTQLSNTTTTGVRFVSEYQVTGASAANFTWTSQAVVSVVAALEIKSVSTATSPRGPLIGVLP